MIALKLLSLLFVSTVAFNVRHEESTIPSTEFVSSVVSDQNLAVPAEQDIVAAAQQGVTIAAVPVAAETVADEPGAVEPVTEESVGAEAAATELAGTKEEKTDVTEDDAAEHESDSTESDYDEERECAIMDGYLYVDGVRIRKATEEERRELESWYQYLMSWFYWFLSFITQPVVELPKFCYEEVTTTTEGSVVLESGKEVAVAKEESVDNESSKKNN